MFYNMIVIIPLYVATLGRRAERYPIPYSQYQAVYRKKDEGELTISVIFSTLRLGCVKRLID